MSRRALREHPAALGACDRGSLPLQKLLRGLALAPLRLDDPADPHPPSLLRQGTQETRDAGLFDVNAWCYQ